MKPYPKEKDTPSRKARKSERNKTFFVNKDAARKIRRERKAAREAELAALEEEQVEE